MAVTEDRREALNMTALRQEFIALQHKEERKAMLLSDGRTVAAQFTEELRLFRNSVQRLGRRVNATKETSDDVSVADDGFLPGGGVAATGFSAHDVMRLEPEREVFDMGKLRQEFAALQRKEERRALLLSDGGVALGQFRQQFCLFRDSVHHLQRHLQRAGGEPRTAGGDISRPDTPAVSPHGDSVDRGTTEPVRGITPASGQDRRCSSTGSSNAKKHSKRQETASALRSKLSEGKPKVLARVSKQLFSGGTEQERAKGKNGGKRGKNRHKYHAVVSESSSGEATCSDEDDDAVHCAASSSSCTKMLRRRVDRLNRKEIYKGTKPKGKHDGRKLHPSPDRNSHHSSSSSSAGDSDGGGVGGSAGAAQDEEVSPAEGGGRALSEDAAPVAQPTFNRRAPPVQRAAIRVGGRYNPIMVPLRYGYKLCYEVAAGEMIQLDEEFEMAQLRRRATAHGKGIIIGQPLSDGAFLEFAATAMQLSFLDMVSDVKNLTPAFLSGIVTNPDADGAAFDCETYMRLQPQPVATVMTFVYNKLGISQLSEVDKRLFAKLCFTKAHQVSSALRLPEASFRHVAQAQGSKLKTKAKPERKTKSRR